MKSRQYYIDRLRSMEKYIRQEYGIVKMTIFGSVAREEQTEDSDLDLYIDTKTPNPFLIMDFKDFVSEALGCKVDVVRRHSNLNKYLQSEIERDGIVVI